MKTVSMYHKDKIDIARKKTIIITRRGLIITEQLLPFID